MVFSDESDEEKSPIKIIASSICPVVLDEVCR